MILSLINLIVCIFTDLLRAYVTTRLWAWFVVPQFGVKPLTVLTAYGVFLLISVVICIIPPYKKDEDSEDLELEKMKYRVIYVTSTTLAIWLFGAIASSFL